MELIFLFGMIAAALLATAVSVLVYHRAWRKLPKDQEAPKPGAVVTAALAGVLVFALLLTGLIMLVLR